MKSSTSNHPDSSRKHERATVDASVRVSTETSGPTHGRAHDISARGMSVYAPLELAIGDSIRMQFTLPNSRMKMDMKAVVKNRIGFRYGVEFVKMLPTETAEIVRVQGILTLTQS